MEDHGDECSGLQIPFPHAIPNSNFHAGQKIKIPVFGRRTGFLIPTFTAFPPKTRCEAHSGRYSGLRILLLLVPSHPSALRPFNNLQVSRLRAVAPTSFVPDHSGVAVPGSHGIPFSDQGHLNTDSFCNEYFIPCGSRSVKLFCFNILDKVPKSAIIAITCITHDLVLITR